ncbi:hypothetical protein N0V93_008026 [Gnomoniopsis smithogilvyi]|uniref:Uncharacterized protein n=1 Tax=Gnomoniopsis smithogilvyi TaxID=1191159 RepID=A0A9W8YM73_9PEZI|nr:hypothetical protein N0V93_008026 [Gnomoniopsis smithogilvyi]
MEEEILPEELEGDNPHQQLQDEELSMARHEGREPEFEHNQSRRHPLSQVTNAVDIVSLLPNRIDDDQENKEFFSDDSTYDHREHAPIIISDDNVEEEAPLDDEGDYGEEEPQDDTFEFLLKHGSKS